MGSFSQDFPFGIMDVVELLREEIDQATFVLIADTMSAFRSS